MVGEKKPSTYLDMAVTDVEDSTIIDHLSTPLQPRAVITVLNYLRYYFAYYATLITRDLTGQAPSESIYRLQAVACRLALTRAFGAYFNQIFSVDSFADNRIGKVIGIGDENDSVS